MSVNGLVVVDKEAGWTSHDVVARCRRIFGQRRVGHAGTLDPDATGVLLVGLGRATRLMRFLTALPKTYTTDIVLGTATSTLDASGEVLGTYDMAHVTPDEVRGRRRRADRRDRAGAAHGVGRQGGRPPPARAGPPGHRGGAPGPAGDRLPLRHRARPGAPGRVPGRGRVLVGHLRPRAGPRPGRARSAAGRTWPTCGARASARSARPTCARSTASAPTPSSRRPGPMRDLDAVTVDRPPPPPSAPGSPSTGCRSGRPATGPGPCSTRRGDLLAVYEATGTDRIRPAVVLAGE